MNRREACRITALTRVATIGGRAMTEAANKGRIPRLMEKARLIAAERGETLTDAEARKRADALLRIHMAEMRAAKRT